MQTGAFPPKVWAGAGSGAAVKTAAVAKIANAAMRIGLSHRIEVMASTSKRGKPGQLTFARASTRTLCFDFQRCPGSGRVELVCRNR